MPKDLEKSSKELLTKVPYDPSSFYFISTVFRVHLIVISESISNFYNT